MNLPFQPMTIGLFDHGPLDIWAFHVLRTNTALVAEDVVVAGEGLFTAPEVFLQKSLPTGKRAFP